MAENFTDAGSVHSKTQDNGRSKLGSLFRGVRLSANAFERGTVAPRYTPVAPKPRKLHKSKASLPNPWDVAVKRVERERRELEIRNAWLRRENAKRRLQTASMMRQLVAMQRLLTMPEGLKAFLRAHFASQLATSV